MALTKSDFEKYRVNEVLASREEPLNACSHQRNFINEREHYSGKGDDTGDELFWLFTNLSTMFLDTIDPNHPFEDLRSSNGPRPIIPEDISDKYLGFLAEIACDVSESHMRARIADVLWLRKRDHVFARLACNSYLQTVDPKNPTYQMHHHAIRALQIAVQLNDEQLAEKALRKARQLANKYHDDKDKWHGLWSEFLKKIAKNYESEREAIVDQISQEALRIEQNSGERGAIPAIGLWEICAELSKGEREQEALQKAIDGLVECAEFNANQREFGGAAGDIRRALELQKKVIGKGEQFTDLQTRFHRYQKRHIANIPLTKHEYKMDQSFTDIVNAFALREMERIKGSTLDVALEKLAKVSHPIKLEPSSLWKNAAFNSRVFHFICPIWPAVLQIKKEHSEKLVNADELEKILANCAFIPKENLRTFTYAMLAGLHSDLVAVAHVLPPQIEKAFRDILRSKEIVTHYISGKMAGQERPLSWILKQEEIIEILDEHLLRDLENLLVERQTGLNLRNNVSHGEWTDDSFFSENNNSNSHKYQIMYLWWLALHLCFTIKKDDAGNIIYRTG